MIINQPKILTAFAILLGVVATYSVLSRSSKPEPVVALTEPEPNVSGRILPSSTGTIDRSKGQAVVVAKQESFPNDETLKQMQLLAPESLAGITPPRLLWNKDGSLVISYDSRAWFEFFRSVPSEEYAQSENYKLAILQEMSEEQRLQMLNLENQYHQLLDAEFQLRQEYSDYGVDAELQRAMLGQSGDQEAWQKAQDMFAERQQLRRELLGDTLTEAWYDQDEAMENYTISALSIARDPTLDESSKATKVAELDHMLPTEVQETIAISRQASELAMSVAQWQNDGWSEQEIEDAIEIQYGSGVAQRWHEAGSAH